MRKLTHSEIEKERKKTESINEYKRNPVYALCDNIRSNSM